MKSHLFSTVTLECVKEKTCQLYYFPYINDIESFMIDRRNVSGLRSITNDTEHDLLVYCQLFILLYEDDTVLLSESAPDLQQALDDFCIYRKKWKLTVNMRKKPVRVMIFSKGSVPKCTFINNGDPLVVVKEHYYRYLRVFFFSHSGSFCKAKNKNTVY